MNEFTINSGNRTICAWSAFPSSSSFPVVIISHGFNGSGTQFSKHMKMLSENNIGVISFDFCGGSINSKSSLKTTEMTVISETEDLTAVIDYAKQDCRITEIYCHGESMGGLVTALVAEKRPDDIKAVSLLYPALCIPDNWTNHFSDIGAIPETFSLWGVSLGKEFFKSIYGHNVFENIGKYPKKVFIAHGDKDEIVPLEYSEKASRIYKNCTLKIFNGEGHGFSEKATDELLEMMLSFFNQS